MGWKYIDDIVWVKPEGAAINRNGGFYQHRKPVAYKPNIVSETIFIFQKPADFLIDKVVRSYSGDILDKSLVEEPYERSNVWKINPETASKHLAPYPKELSDKIVKYYSYVEDLVLDPFMEAELPPYLVLIWVESILELRFIRNILTWQRIE